MYLSRYTTSYAFMITFFSFNNENEEKQDGKGDWDFRSVKRRESESLSKGMEEEPKIQHYCGRRGHLRADSPKPSNPREETHQRRVVFSSRHLRSIQMNRLGWIPSGVGVFLSESPRRGQMRSSSDLEEEQLEKETSLNCERGSVPSKDFLSSSHLSKPDLDRGDRGEAVSIRSDQDGGCSWISFQTCKRDLKARAGMERDRRRTQAVGVPHTLFFRAGPKAAIERLLIN